MIVPRKHVAVSKHIPLLKPQKWSEPNTWVPYENKLNIPFKIIEKNVVDENSVSYSDIIIDDGHPDVRLSPIDDLLKTYRSLDAFTLLNSFVDNIVKTKKESFQIFMIEHAPKDYWIEADLTYFHTIDEFIDGKGLVPNNIYDSQIITVQNAE